ATNYPLSDENVAEVVRAGRTRWKVENENNNTLKTKGYHLEHNFGHGKQHLSSLLRTINILSLLFHTLQELLDNKYQLLRAHLPKRQTFFNDLRALTQTVLRQLGPPSDLYA
ncbi:ISNCY family transposase, partial [Arthrospira platensis PCC 7345]